jgi:hypothetical protein
MLTLESILKAARQMASYGERGTAGALDHLPARVQGQRERKRLEITSTAENAELKKPARRWNDELKIFCDD